MTQSAVTLLDRMGDDLTVVNAARVSFGKRSEALNDNDRRLIGFLARNAHWTPFAHPTLSLHVRAPIYVRAQLFKHKVGLTENEISRRYVDTSPEVIEITEWRGRSVDGAKQGSGPPLPPPDQTFMSAIAAFSTQVALQTYASLINGGVAPEQARSVLPLGTQTEWIWSGTLAAFARVVHQRGAADAQAETREVATAIDAIVRPLFPVSWAALMGESL